LDDLTLTEESELGVFEEWKAANLIKRIESQYGETKLIVTGKESRHRFQSGKWPCGCCGKGVGVNSVLCIACNKWCHQKCSELKKVSGVQG